MNKKFAALLSGAVAAGTTLASAPVFAAQGLAQGYQVAAADASMKAPEGSCGGSKSQEGSCGGNSMSSAGNGKSTEGSCGGSKAQEGSCGASKMKQSASDASGKAMSGGSKSKEGKCGEGKCGGKKK